MDESRPDGERHGPPSGMSAFADRSPGSRVAKGTNLAPGARTPSEWLVASFAVASLAAMLLLLAEDLFFGTSASTDALLLIGLRHLAEGRGAEWDLLRHLMPLATDAGSFPMLVVATAAAVVLLVRRGHRSVALRLAATIAAGMVAGSVLKMIVARPRPEVVTHWTAGTSASFPSGHSTDAALTYLLLACIFDGMSPTRSTARLVTASALSLVALIGTSRLYLGVHWPTDVLGGWCLGAAWAVTATPFVRTGSWRNTIGSSGVPRFDAAGR